MLRPDVILGHKSRAGMLRGFESMARLLALTLGPTGGNIANNRDSSRGPEVLTDAATVIRRIIQLPDRVEDVGAMMMRHIVWNVREEVGDGSATTAVLAVSLAREVERMVAAGANPVFLRRGIEKATRVTIKALDDMSIPLEGEDRIAAVATAATGDEEIGKVLGEIFDVLGPDANIVIEPYVATFHDRAYHEGARFKGTFVSPSLLTDPVRRTAILDDVYVLVTDVPFDSTESMKNVLEQVLKVGGKSVLIICKMMSDKAIGVLVANNERSVIRSCAARHRTLGEVRRGALENMAVLVGAKPLRDMSLTESRDITIDMFGRADRAIVAGDHFTIIGGKGDKKAIRERSRLLRKQIRESYDPEEREDLRLLLVHFSAGVGELRIGALTEQDRQRLTEVAEQAIKAVVSGMESGIVPGGGAAFLACVPAVEALKLEGDEAIGAQVLARALEEPMRCIATNAGAHPPLVITDTRRAGVGYGFDVHSKKVVDMVEAGIMDPTRVVKRALQLASSGALMLVSTEALVLHRKPDETFKP